MEAVPEPSARTFSFGPIERRGLVGGLRPGQIGVLATACGLAVLEVRVFAPTTGLPIALATLGLAALLVFAPVCGRTAEQWLPVLVRWAVAGRGGLHEFRSSAPSAGVVARLDGSHSHRHVDLPAPLQGCEMLSVPVAGGNQVGVFRDPALNALTAVLAIRVRAFGLLGEREQERRLERWGRVLASLSRSDRVVRRLSVLERTVPSDADELQRYLVEARDEALPVADPALRSYEALLQSAGDVTQDHELFVVLQIDERRAAARGRRDGSTSRRTRQELAADVLVREIVALGSRFDPADVLVDGVLSPRMLARAIRLAFDPYGRERLNRLAVACPELDGVDPATFGPTASDVQWDAYRTDGAVHRTYWVSQWPRLAVGPAFLSPLLLSAQVVRSVSITIEPVAPDRARRSVEAAVTAEEADEQLRLERGFRTTARRLKQHQAALRRERELAEGHQEVRFAGFVTVSGRDRAELQQACEIVEQAGHQSYLDLQPLWGQQDVGFTQGALPIARGLRDAGPLGGVW
jgi:hypothetical protein